MATRYSDWAPTAYDMRGLGLADRQDWFVLPCLRTRDSGPLEETNFEAALKLAKEADTEGDKHETHRFGHWGPGWIEIILVHPSLKSVADAVESRLANYPVLDESAWSEREYHEALKLFKSWDYREFIKKLVDVFGLSEPTINWLNSPKVNVEALWRLHLKYAPVAYEWYADIECHFPFNYIESSETLTRNTLAAWIRGVRKEART